MKRLNEESRSIAALKTIRSKFPRHTCEKVDELKKKGDSMWTVDELLAALDDVIDQQEKIEDTVPEYYPTYNSDSTVRHNSPSPRRPHYPALCLETPRASHPYRPSTPDYRCPSSRRVHFHEDNCTCHRPQRNSRTPSPTARNRRSPSSPKHQQRSPSTKRISFGRRASAPPISQSICAPTSQPTHSDVRLELLDEHQAQVGPHSPSSCATSCEEMSAAQMPRLMVVHAVTRNRIIAKVELLTVFLDSTSLARHLGLTFTITRTITTLTFGGHRLTEKSSEVTLTLWDQFDHPITLQLWTRDVITTVPQTNNDDDAANDYCDERVEVDVLIGIDNYWRIVDLHRNEELPSGLILSHTRFEPVLSGAAYPEASNITTSAMTILDDDAPGTEQLVRSLLGLDTVGLDDRIRSLMGRPRWDTARKWNEIVQEISSFHLNAPRFVGHTSSNTLYRDRPYGQKPTSTLLFAKAKLAPPGAITIPRMELLACHMAAKTAQFLGGQLKIQLYSIRFLTDSQIVLYWIQTSKTLKTYVANRVNYIRQVLSELKSSNIDSGFYYIPTDNNPADCATHGLTAAELEKHIWWRGLSFITTPFTEWPCRSFDSSSAPPSGGEAELVRTNLGVVMTTSTILMPYKSFVPFRRRNSYIRLTRIISYVLKCIAKLRHRARTRNAVTEPDEHRLFGTIDATTISITSSDMTAAELVLIREHYREESQQLNGSYVKKLRTRHEEDGTIRVNLRMANAEQNEPILILSDRGGPQHQAPLPSQLDEPDAVVLRPIDLINPQFRLGLNYNLPKRIKSSSSDNYESLCTRYNALRKDLDHFWDIWQKDYLGALANREATRSRNGRGTIVPPRVGDIVIIREQDVPRSIWPLGLILQLHTSPDGQVRPARIRTCKRHILDRAINHLVPLEISARHVEDIQTSKQQRQSTRKRPSRKVKSKH
ncbi:unnamed protein product [Cylicocyclus nassatus]|uniref:DUF5641 domain-containing protein n=1 Tax=Cylicocyclus nassatus TaxID=53992 RepID=A0AA36H5V0_CYLNA|nr:unnamed protein product [Cylicocyclus nassatus]